MNDYNGISGLVQYVDTIDSSRRNIIEKLISVGYGIPIETKFS